jgi:hypothetical protein
LPMQHKTSAASQCARAKLCQCGELPLQLVGVPAVVGIEKRDVMPGRRFEPGVASGRRPAVLMVYKQPDPRIAQRRDHFLRIIGGAVVDDDQLEIGMALRLDAGDRVGNRTAPVEYRNNDGDLRYRAAPNAAFCPRRACAAKARYLKRASLAP